jgi:serine/threonine protein kinase
MASQTFDKYVTSELLGSGGMAEVYAALHPDLGRKVAIKVILPQFATDDTFEQRFRREARLVASLRHPHIVQIYDFDVVEGRYFMVMEYLEGGTLKEHLRSFSRRNAKMPPAEIASILDAMGSALDYAHGRGAIHRDIKPPNILFTADRQPVLSDFGIAKLLEDGAHLTATGGVVGSPFYMPPEQATGGEVDAASDQYSLGVVLYEMVTGRVPFLGNSAVAVMTQHLNSAPPAPRSLNAELPDAVDAVLLKVLSKRPDQRFASAGELAQAFRAAIHGQSYTPVAMPAQPQTAGQTPAQADENERTLLENAVDSSVSHESATLTLADASPADATEATPSARANDKDGAATLIDAQGQAASPVQPEPLEPMPSALEPPPAEVVKQPLARHEDAELAAPQKADLTPGTTPPAAPPPTAPPPTTLPPKPTTQHFHTGGIQAGIVNQGGEQTFSGDLTFNLDFGEIKSPPPQQEVPQKSAVPRGEMELAAILETLRRAFAGSGRVDRFVRLVTQFNDQLEALPAERDSDRKQVVKRVQALLMEMTEAKPDADMVEIMGTSLQRAVQPLAVIDPDLPTLATRITSWVEMMVEPK